MIRHSRRVRDRNSICCHAATVIVALATVLLAACGGGGSSSNPPPPPPPPAASLSYVSPQVYTVGAAIASLKPTITGTLSNFTVSPQLPLGLAMDGTTGIISGTPTVVAAQKTYTVNATGAAGGGASASITIAVTDVPPSSISYGGALVTFTAGVAARLLTPTWKGGAVVSWSISPSLPAGLAFSTTDGSISGTPTATSFRNAYTVTAQNSGGKATASFSIEVDSSVLIDFGHVNPISVVRFSGSRVLSEDTSGHWVLWDYGVGKRIQDGDSDCNPNACALWLLADVAGSTAVIKTKSGFEVYSSVNGQHLSTITASTAWWQLASDGSYVCAGSQAGLLAWSPSGGVLFSRSGDYSKAIAFAAPSEIRVGAGPAGQNVIETVAAPSGTATTGPTFQGQFSSWFLDGARFLTVAGNTVAVYSSTSVRQDLQTLPTVAGLTGQGNWFWTYPNTPSTINVYAVGAGSSPTATYSGVSFVIPSALTILAGRSGTAQLSVIDLSGAAPTETTFASPNVQPIAYAAISSKQWVGGEGNGILFDGANFPSIRYFALGQPFSIAAGTSTIALATAQGNIVIFDASTLAQTRTIQFASLKLVLSSDGTVLAALGGALGGDCSVNIYSLPSATLLHNWSYSCTGSTVPTDINLSGSGTTLGQVLFTTGSLSYTELVTPATGGSAIYSNTFALSTGFSTPPIRLSPDGSLIAAATTDWETSVEPGQTPGTNIFKNGTLVTAVTGLPGGWIDNTRLFMGNYQRSPLDGSGPPSYTGCTIHDPSGQSVGSCSLPELRELQPITSDFLYSPEWNSIFSVSAGTARWTSGDPLANTGGGYPFVSSVGAVAAGSVVFQSGPRVLVQSY